MNCDPFFNLVGVQKDLMCCLLKNNWPWPYTFWRIKAFLRWRCVSTVPLFLCVNCSSGPCCKLFLWSYVSSVSFFFLVLCLQRFSGSVNHLFLWSCVPTVSLFLNAYCSFIPECLLFPWSCMSTIPSLACVQRSLSPLCTKSYGSMNLWSCVSTVALFLSAHWECGPVSPPSL